MTNIAITEEQNTKTNRVDEMRNHLRLAAEGLAIINMEYERVATGDRVYATFPHVGTAADVQLKARKDTYRTVLDICGYLTITKWVEQAHVLPVTETDVMKMLTTVHMGLKVAEQMLERITAMGWIAAPQELNKELAGVYLSAQKTALQHSLEMCDSLTLFRYMAELSVDAPMSNSGVYVELRWVDTPWGSRYEAYRTSGYRAGRPISHGMTETPIRFLTELEAIAWLQETGYSLDPAYLAERQVRLALRPNPFVTSTSVFEAEVTWFWSQAVLHDFDYKDKVEKAILAELKLVEGKYGVQHDTSACFQWEGYRLTGPSLAAVEAAALELATVLRQFKDVEPLF